MMHVFKVLDSYAIALNIHLIMYHRKLSSEQHWAKNVGGI